MFTNQDYDKLLRNIFNAGKIIVSPELYKIMMINGKITFFIISSFFNQFNNAELIDINDHYSYSQKNTIFIKNYLRRIAANIPIILNDVENKYSDDLEELSRNYLNLRYKFVKKFNDGDDNDLIFDIV